MSAPITPEQPQTPGFLGGLKQKYDTAKNYLSGAFNRLASRAYSGTREEPTPAKSVAQETVLSEAVEKPETDTRLKNPVLEKLHAVLEKDLVATADIPNSENNLNKADAMISDAQVNLHIIGKAITREHPNPTRQDFINYISANGAGELLDEISASMNILETVNLRDGVKPHDIIRELGVLDGDGEAITTEEQLISLPQKTDSKDQLPPYQVQIRRDGEDTASVTRYIFSTEIPGLDVEVKRHLLIDTVIDVDLVVNRDALIDDFLAAPKRS